MGWIVSQIGAREHYAVARGLGRLGLLERLFTDAWCHSGARLLRHGPGPVRRFAGRRNEDIPSHRVTSFNIWAWSEALRRAPTSDEARYRAYLRIGTEYGKRVAAALQRRPPQPGLDVFFGYDTGALECLRLLRARGVFTIVDQIDPGPEGHARAMEESRVHPGWEPQLARVPEEYYDRLRDEWATADLVVVNSTWSRDSLIRQNVPADKVAVVPCAYDAPPGPPFERSPHGPLRVLWVGHVSLRKGIAYLLEAARIAGNRINVRIVGAIGISREAVRSAPPNVTFEGPVPRDNVAQAYRQADVFVFPTLSDGFGITQIEAMSHGLPVIATRNCGEVVTHDQDGLIVPAGDADSLASAMQRLDADRGLVAEMSRRARESALRFSTDRVTGDLLRSVALARHSARPGAGARV
jgi:glycosyltransferase involved in cell wall biosynthesis